MTTLIQCAKLCDWKLIPYLERKKDKLDLIGELALERAFNVHTSTMPLWLFNKQNRKRKVLTINCVLKTTEILFRQSKIMGFQKNCLFLDFTRIYMYILFTITVQKIKSKIEL